MLYDYVKLNDIQTYGTGLDKSSDVSLGWNLPPTLCFAKRSSGGQFKNGRRPIIYGRWRVHKLSVHWRNYYMPLPKRQHSRQRGRKRRTHWKLSISGMGVCPQCKKSILSHRVCPYCGFYKGVQVVEIKVKAEKKKKP